jgi:hypothetical protein
MPYVETLADIIQTGDTPLTIGTWESNKISLMKMVTKELSENSKISKPFSVYLFKIMRHWPYLVPIDIIPNSEVSLLIICLCS